MQSWHRRTRLENGEVVEEAVAALHSIKEQSRAAHCRKHHACTPNGDNGSNGGAQSQDQEIVINTGNESLMIAPAVVTPALHSIKERSRAAHCRKHDACTPDGDDGSNGGDQSQDQEIRINTATAVVKQHVRQEYIMRTTASGTAGMARDT